MFLVTTLFFSCASTTSLLRIDLNGPDMEFVSEKENSPEISTEVNSYFEGKSVYSFNNQYRAVWKNEYCFIENFDTGEKSRIFTVGRGVTDIVFAPDNHSCAVLCYGGDLLVVDIESLKIISELEVDTETFSPEKVVYSNNGNVLCLRYTNTFSFWNTETGEYLSTIQLKSGPYTCAIDDISMEILVTKPYTKAGSHRFDVYSILTGASVRTFNINLGRIYPYVESSIVFSGDGKKIIRTGSTTDGFKQRTRALTCYDANNGEKIWEHGGSEEAPLNIDVVPDSFPSEFKLQCSGKETVSVVSSSSYFYKLSGNDSAVPGEEQTRLWEISIADGSIIDSFPVNSPGSKSSNREIVSDQNKIIDASNAGRMFSSEPGTLKFSQNGVYYTWDIEKGSLKSVLDSKDLADGVTCYGVNSILSLGVIGVANQAYQYELWNFDLAKRIAAINLEDYADAGFCDPEHITSVHVSPTGKSILFFIKNYKDPDYVLVWDINRQQKAVFLQGENWHHVGYRSEEIIGCYDSYSDSAPEYFNLVSGQKSAAFNLKKSNETIHVKNEGDRLVFYYFNDKHDEAEIDSFSIQPLRKLMGERPFSILDYHPENHAVSVIQDKTLAMYSLSEQALIWKKEIPGLLKDDHLSVYYLKTESGLARVDLSTGHIYDSSDLGTMHEYIIKGTPIGIKLWENKYASWEIPENELIKIVTTTNGEWFVITPDGRFDCSAGGKDFIKFYKGEEEYASDQLWDSLYTPGILALAVSGELKPREEESIISTLEQAPEVTIISPESKTTEANQAVVKVQVEDSGNGIGDVYLYVNGKTYNRSTRGLKIARTGSTYEFSIQLIPGENRIKAVAENGNGTIEGWSDEVVITCTPPEQILPSLHILSIGVSDYQDQGIRLNAPDDDSRMIAKVFSDLGENLYGDVTQTVLVDRDARLNGIRAGFKSMLETANPEDTVIVFFAGHGFTENQRFYYLPQDADITDLPGTALSIDEISRLTQEISASKIVLLFDTCQSGDAAITLSQIAMSRGFDERKAIADLAKQSGIMVFAATSPGMNAYEISELGNGVFTYSIIKAIKEKKDAISRDSYVTINKLMSEVDFLTREISYEYLGFSQNPIRYNFGQDFSIGRLK